jgi:hypothetical protein
MLEQVKDDLNQIASESVRVGLVEFVRYLLSTIPPERKRTRRACRIVHSDGDLVGFSGAVFPSSERFPTSGTRTRKIVTSAWQRKQQDVFNSIQAHCAESIANMKPLFHITVKG